MEGLRKTTRRPQTRSTIHEDEGEEACASDVPFEGQTRQKQVVEVEVHGDQVTSQLPDDTTRETRSRESMFHRAMSEDPEVSEAAVREYAEQYISDPAQVDTFMAARARASGQNPKQVDVRPKTTFGINDQTAQQPARLNSGQATVVQGDTDPMAVLMQDIKGIVGNAMRGVSEYMADMVSNLESAYERPARRGRGRQQPARRAELSSDEEAEINSFAGSDRPTHPASQIGTKLPPFTGKERWEVWYTRFSEVARLNHWSEHRKLQELLPRLQGQAGDFAYSQLPREVRGSYGRLIAELNSRFQVVETRKTYAAQFSNRIQKPGETTEEFAAELKRMYNKAYPNRDEQTRKEDLLRKFLDGLYDERARFHIEFVKEPDSIDQAIYEAVNFQETRRRPPGKDGRPNRPTRAVHCHYSSDSDEDRLEKVQPAESDDSDEERIARVPPRSGKSKKIKRLDQTATKANSDPGQVKENSSGSGTAQQFQKLLEEVEKLKQQLSHQEGRASATGSGGARSVNPNDRRRDRNNHRCFKCGEDGHFAKRCPHFKWVQVPANEPISPPTQAVTPATDVSSAPVQRNTDMAQLQSN